MTPRTATSVSRTPSPTAPHVDLTPQPLSPSVARSATKQRLVRKPRPAVVERRNSVQAGGEQVATGVRLRPQFAHERGREPGVCVEIQPPSRVVLADPQRQQVRSFDCNFAFDSSDPSSPQYTDQQAVYKSIGAEVVDQAVQGYNCCLCAYGQTGAGKTYTIHGDWASAEHRGLLPRITEGLFGRIDQLKAGGAEARMQVSYIEIYNNRLHDLLAPATASGAGRRDPGAWAPPAAAREGRLEIRTHPTIGVYVDNLSEVTVRDFRDVRRLVTVGDRLKHTATTSMNSRSSRSHTIFTFKLEVRGAPSGVGQHMAAAQIADLAGRENEQTSECVGERFQELTFINRSLFQLANCVHALSDGKSDHVPFRNSKLTMLLSESFQRNSRTYLLATLTPSVSGYEENLLTCRFLESTGRISTQPVINRFCAEDLCGQLQDEINTMRLAHGLQVPEAIAPQLKERQALLRQMTVNWTDGKLVPRGQLPPVRGENAKEVLVLDACSQVGSTLDKAAQKLQQLVEVNTAAASSLGEAERRFSAFEERVQEARRRRPARPRPGRHGCRGVIRMRQGGGPGLPPLAPMDVESTSSDSEVEAVDAPVSARVAKREKGAVPVTFSISLPEIVVR